MRNFRFTKKAVAVAMSFVLVGTTAAVMAKGLEKLDIMYTEPFNYEEKIEKEKNFKRKKLVK